MVFNADKKLVERVKIFFSDVDGVFTNNQVLEGATHKGKWRSYYDGQGTSLLRAIGIRVCFITNEKDESAKAISDVVAKLNKLPSSEKNPGDGGWHHVKLYTGMGGTKKIIAAEEYLAEVGLSFDDAAFMGDDLVDVPLLRRVALRAAPISAEKIVKDIAHFISERPGGNGAIRDFANFILECRGVDPFTLSPQ
ncbi:MAG: HAD hydrolase family protein [Candidatus Yanofskybacteria bacterium]|nr:HAD hydrolase family protein [Candidatus Yanofskybacteria bacterium]